MAFKKNSKFSVTVNRVVVRMREAGILDHIIDKFLNKKVESKMIQNPEVVLKLNDITGIIFTMLAMLGVSAVVFLLEIIWYFSKLIKWRKIWRYCYCCLCFRCFKGCSCYSKTAKLKIKITPKDFF